MESSLSALFNDIGYVRVRFTARNRIAKNTSGEFGNLTDSRWRWLNGRLGWFDRKHFKTCFTYHIQTQTRGNERRDIKESKYHIFIK